MINFNKIDDHDLIFVNKPLNAKEEKEFSDFLKDRKSKAMTMKTRGPKIKPNREFV